MNCDQVFEVLTRGPFPTGERSDRQVERHLVRCSSCRRLAAALQPAIELFEEAVTPEESRSLPAYSGNAFATVTKSPARRTTPLAVVARKRTLSSRTSRLVREAWPGMWRVAAAVMLGILLGEVLRSADRSNPQPELARDTAPAIAGGSQSTTGRSTTSTATTASLADAFGLSTLCSAALQTLKGRDKNVETAASASPFTLSDLACCTKCHTASSSQGMAKDHVVAIAMSCRTCHD